MRLKLQRSAKVARFSRGFTALVAIRARSMTELNSRFQWYLRAVLVFTDTCGCALAVTAAIFVGQAGGNMWLAVTLVSIAAASHQGWSANLFTLPSDMLPRNAVGSVVGLGGMCGALSGALVAPAIGYWLDFSHKAYGPLFVVAGSMYLIALGIIQLLVPDIRHRDAKGR